MAAAGAPVPDGNRYLFIVNVGSSMGKMVVPLQQTMIELVGGGLEGWMRDGDTFGVWTYNDRISTEFPMQVWEESRKQALAAQVVEHLKAQRFAKRGRITAVLPDMYGVVSFVRDVTVIFITDSDDSVKGTVLDAEINSALKKIGPEMRAAGRPVIIALVAKGGQFVRWGVNSPEMLYPLPNPPPQTNPVPALASESLPLAATNLAAVATAPAAQPAAPPAAIGNNAPSQTPSNSPSLGPPLQEVASQPVAKKTSPSETVDPPKAKDPQVQAHSPEPLTNSSPAATAPQNAPLVSPAQAAPAPPQAASAAPSSEAVPAALPVPPATTPPAPKSVPVPASAQAASSAPPSETGPIAPPVQPAIATPAPKSVPALAPPASASAASTSQTVSALSPAQAASATPPSQPAPAPSATVQSASSTIASNSAPSSLDLERTNGRRASQRASIILTKENLKSREWAQPGDLPPAPLKAESSLASNSPPAQASISNAPPPISPAAATQTDTVAVVTQLLSCPGPQKTLVHTASLAATAANSPTLVASAERAGRAFEPSRRDSQSNSSAGTDQASPGSIPAAGFLPNGSGGLAAILGAGVGLVAVLAALLIWRHRAIRRQPSLITRGMAQEKRQPS